MKRIIICMDGTWQNLYQDELTNIGVIARSIAHKETRPDGSTIQQTVIYTLGVGSSLSALSDKSLLQKVSTSFNRLAGGAIGEGLEDLILDTYLRLAFNYEAGDEIYIFGFSRGAFAARRLSGFINTAGIVSRRHINQAREGFRLYYRKPRSTEPEEKRREHAEEAAQFRRLYGKGERNEDGTRRQTDAPPQIKFVGVFDTVAQRGAGDVLLSMTPWGDRERHRFKNYRVSPNVESARHAVALDESRLGFPVTLWDGIEEDNARIGRRVFEQRWFVGTHGDVGGGSGSKLSALALKWIAEGARDAGLRFYGAYGDDRSPLEERLNDAGMCFAAAITRPPLPRALQPIHYPWRARKVWGQRGKPSIEDAQSLFHESVMQRAAADHLRPRYLPASLKPFKSVLREWSKAQGEHPET
jgi:uncharacterized protein (DUF2235 family)